MLQNYYKYILGFIFITVLATVGLQTYWNYKNYGINKQQLQKEIQLLFDQSVTDYFDQVSKEDVVSFLSTKNEVSSTEFLDQIKIDTLFSNWKSKALPGLRNEDKLEADALDGEITNISLSFSETTSKATNATNKDTFTAKFPDILTSKEGMPKAELRVIKGQKALDALGDLTNFKNRIVISMTRDSIDYQTIDSIFYTKLSTAKIPLDYTINHTKADTLFETFPIKNQKLLDSIQTSATALKQHEKLNLAFNMPTSLLFYRMSAEIGLSLLLALAVLGCLLFLLKVINQQKRIDEIKNDFISNMTHEFKTPIATITSAIEGMTHFNPTNDPEKSKRYLAISNQQLQKLTEMVEKILEVSSLKTDQLKIKLESVPVNQIIESTLAKFQSQTTKNIHYESVAPEICVEADGFYLEQVFSNLLDNAIKYGGQDIFIAVKTAANQVQIDVSDNGEGIPKASQSQIFDQFYRVPKGNLHDVKGFGIGLYFAKTIIEKCHGSLQFVPNPRTTFSVILPQIK
uniref:sensor histidine kinase n=1 Tax=Flavobacterium sp. TaxID=239 RepID=UPI00404B101B